jgi:RIO kinase 1
MSDKARERIAHREKTVERRDKMLIKDFTANRATVEEVFDQSTRMVLFSFLQDGSLDEVHGVISSGKEARVYWGKNRDGKEIAVKIYLTSSAEFLKGMRKYIDGDRRFRNVKHNTRSLIFTWAQKEFRNLQEASRAGVRVPKPIAIKNNVVLMEFIGKDGVSAPTLKENSPRDPEKAYSVILGFLERLYKKAELVHGDLSEYNMMMWKGRLIVFDMSQSVPTSHPMAEFLLRRDIENVNRFFSRLGVKVKTVDELYKQVVG